MTLHVGCRFKFASIFGFLLAVYPLELDCSHTSSLQRYRITVRPTLQHRNFLDAPASSLGHADREQELKASSMYSFQAQKVARRWVGGGNQLVNVFLPFQVISCQGKLCESLLSRSLQLCDRDSKDLNWLLVFGKALY